MTSMPRHAAYAPPARRYYVICPMPAQRHVIDYALMPRHHRDARVMARRVIARFTLMPQRDAAAGAFDMARDARDGYALILFY